MGRLVRELAVGRSGTLVSKTTNAAVPGFVGVDFAAATLELANFGVTPSAGGWSDSDVLPRMVGRFDGSGPAVDIVGFGFAGALVATSSFELVL